jgi:hypothetical protein
MQWCCCARDEKFDGEPVSLLDSPKVSLLTLNQTFLPISLPAVYKDGGRNTLRSDAPRAISPKSAAFEQEWNMPAMRVPAAAKLGPPQNRSVGIPAGVPFPRGETQARNGVPHQAVLLLDWDDTLFPSNWFTKETQNTHVDANDIFDYLSVNRQASLSKLQNYLGGFLRSALKVAKVAIVTNASEPWVTFSVEKLLPSLLPEVQNIPVIYARSFANGDPDFAGLQGANQAKEAMQIDVKAPQRWKEHAFRKVIGDSWQNIISVGDQSFEREAARQVVADSGRMAHCRLKTTKFIENPDIDELCAELRMLHDALESIILYEGNLDVEIDQADLKHGKRLVATT